MVKHLRSTKEALALALVNFLDFHTGVGAQTSLHPLPDTFADAYEALRRAGFKPRIRHGQVVRQTAREQQ